MNLNLFEKSEEPSPSEWMAIGTFILFMLVTLQFTLSVVFAMIMLGTFSLLSREKK